MIRLAGTPASNRAVIALVAIAIVVRALAALHLGDAFHFADETEYVDAANKLLRGQELGSIYKHPPGYAFFLAFLGAPLPDGVLPLRLGQAVVTGIGSVLVLLVGSRMFGPGPAALGAVLYALDPLAVVAGSLLYSEAMAAVLLAATIWMTTAAAKSNRLTEAALTGALLGIVSQFRPVAMAIVPVVCLWVAATVQTTFARRTLHVLVICAACVLTLVPWTYRNYQVYGRVKPIATAGTETAPVSSHAARRDGLATTMVAKAWSAPSAMVRRTGWEFVHFWELYPTRVTTDDAWHRNELHKLDSRLPRDSAFSLRLRDAVSAISFGIELTLAVIGLGLAVRTRRREALLIAGVILAYAFGYSLFIAKFRYRITVLPLLFMLSGVGAHAILTWAVANVPFIRSRVRV